MSLPLILLQMVAPVAAPDIELHARVTAREVTVIQRGTARLEVRADPPLDRQIEVVAPRLPPGGTTLRNVTVTVDAAATVAGPDTPRTSSESQSQRQQGTTP